ncbi:MAG: enoyl-CoA hydratase/isomerase family protein [Acidaminococcales bacterium]|jgi:2-(1,2-epoxy-1,2-dihydrophenyl)acetyl-CoA isomerase|nr:enoyl-CoA hydratase/isomerase family protein [Acidaminococcales bacterium]
MYETIIVEKKDKIAALSFNRPDVLNAMDFVMREEIRLALIDLERDDNIQVVVVTGKGRGFCSGADLSATMGTKYRANAGRKRMRNVFPLYKSIMNSDKIFIAAINGAISGSGLSLACCCDFRFAADTAKFGLPFANIGLIPDCGLLYNLPRLIGVAKTKELAMLAEKFDANKALDLGLVTKVVKADDLLPAVDEFAKTLCKKSYVSLAMTKSILNRTFELTFDNLLEQEAGAQDICFLSDFHNDAIADILRNMKDKK